jgi:peptide deformylase
MFVMEGLESKLYIINPVILQSSMVTALFQEGCLSAPGEVVVTGSRREWVEVQYNDEKGETFRSVFSGIHSVCVQHEIEHLEGKSFMESKTIPKAIRKQLAKKWGFTLE